MHRIAIELFDLLQFHGSDYGNDQYLAGLDFLAQLQQADKIKHQALTNFGMENLQRIIAYEIKIVLRYALYSIQQCEPQILTHR